METLSFSYLNYVICGCCDVWSIVLLVVEISLLRDLSSDG